MVENPFVLPTAAYHRDLSLLKTYVGDAALYLSKMTGKPLDECNRFVKQTIHPASPSGMAFKDPNIVYLERQDNGDRVKREGKLYSYIAEALASNDLIAPTLTTYLPPTRTKALLVDFIDGNVKGRSKAKKEMFKAVAENNKPVAALKKIEQTGRKLSNNALSGAHVSASTPLYNKTAHSTLTSTCRSTSGYGNANNEKFLCGNRHYWCADIVRNNLVSILNHTDYAAQAQAMQEFGVRAPTAEETLQCILYSTDLYWRGQKEKEEFQFLISKLSDAERAAFVYTGDLYHLRKFNEPVVREFISRLSARVIPATPRWANQPWSDVKQHLEQYPEDQWHLASQICAEYTRGKKTEELTGTPAMDVFVATLENIFQTLQAYQSLIRAFWVTDNVPASMAVFPDSIRRAAITSDTDSTIFTVQEWVIWHEGRLRFTPEGCAVAAAMIFLASQTITHVLARMSANFGIEQERLYQIAMKNEFYFPVFVPTQVAKHYFALIAVQEGLVFKDFETEIKGVHLKSSNAPPSVMKDAKKMMEFIMNTIYQEKPISIVEILKWVARVEHEVMTSIRKGSHEYFRKGQIKTPESYVEGRNAAPWQQYELWRDVFAPKYGEMPPPPYMSVKISVDLNSPAKTKEWLEGLADKEFVARMEAWLAATGKKAVGTTFMLPEALITSRGIPEEIVAIMGLRKMVLDTSKVFYLILEVLGVYMLNNKNTRLVSDIY